MDGGSGDPALAREGVNGILDPAELVGGEVDTLGKGGLLGFGDVLSPPLGVGVADPVDVPLLEGILIALGVTALVALRNANTGLLLLSVGLVGELGPAKTLSFNKTKDSAPGAPDPERPWWEEWWCWMAALASAGRSGRRASCWAR